jgi:hypothetical protein
VKNIDFELKLSMKRPIYVEGYGLRTADEGIDPEEWGIYINKTDSLGNMLKKNWHVSSKKNT